MPTAHPPYPSWAAGEISPRLMGRIDVNWYHIAARMMLNMRPLPQGPAERRGGFRFVDFPGEETDGVRLLPFVFAAEDADQVHLAAVSDAGIEILRDAGTTLAGGLSDGWGKVAAADTDAAITNGDFPSGITGWTDQSTGTGAISHDATNDRLNLDGAAASIAIAEQAPTTTATGTEHILKFTLYGSRYDEVDVYVGSSSGASDYLNVTLRCGQDGAPHAMQFTPAASPFYIQFRNAAAKTVQVDDVSLVDAAALTIAAPWAAAERAGIKHTQSNDLLYLCHRAHWPRVLERRGSASWSLPEYPAEDGPYLPENITATTLTPGAATGLGVTLTASAVTGINDDAGFKSSDVGRLVTLKHSTTWGWGVIVGFTSTTVVTIDVRSNFGGTGAVTVWRLGLWRAPAAAGAGLDGGYPTHAKFAEERLVFFGSPGRIASTKTGDFVTFGQSTDDDGPLNNTIADNQTNAARWLAQAGDLLLGTAGAEFRMRAASGASLTPGNVAVRVQSRRGSADVQALEIGNAVLFLERHGRKLIELEFALEIEAYRDVDLTRRAEHLTRAGGGLARMVHQAEPYGMIWAVRGDGLLPSLTYLRDEQVIAWARHACGASAAGLAEVEDVCVVPGVGRDLLFAVVKRTIDATVRRSIELLEEPLPDDAHPADGFYVDMGLTLDNTPAATLTPAAAAATAGATGVTFTAGSSVFVAGDVGRLIHYRHQVTVEMPAGAPDPEGQVGVRTRWETAIAEITGYTSGTVVTATIRSAFPSDVAGSAIASGGWRLTVTTVTGLDHLEGEALAICGDGAVQPSQTVASGAVTLDSPAATVHLGLGYPSVLIPVRYEAAAPDGTAQGRRQQPNRLMARLWRTGEGFKFGALRDKAAAFDTVAPPIRQVTDAMDAAPGLFSGDAFAALPAPLQRDPLIAFVQSQPLPATVVMLVPKVEVNE